MNDSIATVAKPVSELDILDLRSAVSQLIEPSNGNERRTSHGATAGPKCIRVLAALLRANMRVAVEKVSILREHPWRFRVIIVGANDCIDRRLSLDDSRDLRESVAVNDDVRVDKHDPFADRHVGAAVARKSRASRRTRDDDYLIRASRRDRR